MDLSKILPDPALLHTKQLEISHLHMKDAPIPFSSSRPFGFSRIYPQYNHPSYALSSHLTQRTESSHRSKLVLIAALFLLALRIAQVFPLTSKRIRSLLLRLILSKKRWVFTVDTHDGHMMQKCNDNFFQLYAFGSI